MKQANVKGFPRRLGLPDNVQGVLFAGRVVISARNIDGKGIHAGFLYADSVQQAVGRVFGPYSQRRKSQYKQQRNDSLHVICLVLCVERMRISQPRRAGQEVA